MSKILKSLEDFMGPQGTSILKRALKQTDAEAEDAMAKLQILPRAIISWSFNIIKNVSEKASNHFIPNTDYVLNIKKSEDNKIDFEILKKTETIIAQKSVELPSLILKLFELTDALDIIEKNFNENQEDLQNAINFLIERFHFSNNVKVTIDKSEVEAKCPDCGQMIGLHDNNKNLCICFSVLKKSLHVRKNDNNTVSLNFGDKWTKGDIFLLMKTLKNRSQK